MFWACFLLFLCCLCYFLFPTLRGVHLLSGRLLRVVRRHDRDEAFYQRYKSTDKMIVIFRSLESGKILTMCMDAFDLSRILECYDIHVHVQLAYTRVYFFSPSTGVNYSVSVHSCMMYIKNSCIYLIKGQAKAPPFLP